MMYRWISTLLACAALTWSHAQTNGSQLGPASDAAQRMHDNGFQARQDSVLDIATLQEQPDYPGGMEAMYAYLQANTRYPDDAFQGGVEGKVYVEFVVNKEGQVGNVRIRRGVSPSLDAEAIRVVLGMPRWSPGRKDGTPVAVRFTIPLVFKLNKEQPQAPPAGTH